MSNINQNRMFMHCPSFKDRMAESDQSKGIKAPPFGKPITGEVVSLPPFDGAVAADSYVNLLDIRRSKRKFAEKPITGPQLAFLLWSTQGIQEYRSEVATLRPCPSGGARHPFELYVSVKNVEGLEPGLYHYLPTENVGKKRCTIERIKGNISEETIADMLSGQKWASKASAVLFFSCIPYKAEWRYVDLAHRVMLIDLGHAGQNTMLSAASLGLGSCCIAAYNQKLCDETLGFDGMDEYTVYAIALGVPEE